MNLEMPMIYIQLCKREKTVKPDIDTEQLIQNWNNYDFSGKNMDLSEYFFSGIRLN